MTNIFIGVHGCLSKAIATQPTRCIGLINGGPSSTDYLMFKPANVTHLWIEEDLIYTSVCQAFGGLIISIAVVKAYLAGSSVQNFSIQNGGGTCSYQLQTVLT